MIPSPQELEEISRAPEGDLKSVPFAVLVSALARHERTAVLSLKRRQLEKDVVFEYGVPVDCRSNMVHETLARFMMSQGRLTQEEHDAYLRESVTREVPMGEVLREHGVLGSSELFRILQANLAKKLLDVFTWSDGSYHLELEAAQVHSPLKVKVPQLVVTGVTKFAPQAEVNAAVWPLVGKKLGLHPGSPPQGLKLSPAHQRLVDLLADPRTVKELSEASEVPFEAVTRLVYALALLGAVAPADELPAAPAAATAPAPAAVPPSPAPPSGAAADDSLSAQEVAALQDRLMEAYLAHRRQDAFDLLGVPEDAPVAVIRERYLDFAHRYAPWRFKSARLAGLVDEASDLFYAGARAFGELMNTEQRNTLLYRRKVLREEKSRPKAQVGIETDLLDPQKQYDKGLALARQGSYREAADLLEFAADCDPGNGLYRAEAAYCRYRTDPQIHGRKALEDLEEALRIDPRCGLAAYYAGEVARERGEHGRAETLLRQATDLLPDLRHQFAFPDQAESQRSDLAFAAGELRSQSLDLPKRLVALDFGEIHEDGCILRQDLERRHERC